MLLSQISDFGESLNLIKNLLAPLVVLALGLVFERGMAVLGTFVLRAHRWSAPNSDGVLSPEVLNRANLARHLEKREGDQIGSCSRTESVEDFERAGRERGRCRWGGNVVHGRVVLRGHKRGGYE